MIIWTKYVRRAESRLFQRSRLESYLWARQAIRPEDFWTGLLPVTALQKHRSSFTAKCVVGGETRVFGGEGFSRIVETWSLYTFQQSLVVAKGTFDSLQFENCSLSQGGVRWQEESYKIKFFNLIASGILVGNNAYLHLCIRIYIYSRSIPVLFIYLKLNCIENVQFIYNQVIESVFVVHFKYHWFEMAARII